jgi:serine/threonine protein phosphatase PrpC
LFSADRIFVATRDLIFAMLSDRGRVRRRNEDTCAASSLAGVFVVCDGMGGAAGGEVASHLAAETFLSHFASHSSSSTRMQVRIQAAVQAANRAIFRQGEKDLQLSGMGTTLVGLLQPPANVEEDEATPHRENGKRSGSSVWLVHVGDSRCYRWRDKGLERLTADHSLVEEQVRAGQITAAQALESPMRNLITRVVGSQDAVEPEIRNCRSRKGDLYLLASDGLTRDLTDDEIAAILCRVPGVVTEAALYSACRELVAAANAKGGGDNITVLLVAPNALLIREGELPQNC